MFGLAPRSRNNARQSKLQPPVAGKDGDSLALGRRVRTHPKGLLGVVRWTGPTHFSAGTWVGVELDTAEGRNDGEVQGSRYFTCASGHGVFVRPDHCVAVKGTASISGPVSTTPSRDRRARGSFSAQERAPGTLPRKGSQLSLASEHLAATHVPSHAWGTPSEPDSFRKDSRRDNGPIAMEKRNGGAVDDQIIGRILASEAFARILSAAVTDRVRAGLSSRDSQKKLEQENLIGRMTALEQMVDDAGGAMDDIAEMVNEISETVAATGVVKTDLRDAAAGGSGDAGGGGRDDARVAELTKLLCTVHDMSSQAAELLRTERKENHARVRYLTDRVKSLEKANRNSLEGLGDVPSEPSEG